MLTFALLLAIAPPVEPTPAERAVCAGSAALGAIAGAVLGSSAALGMGASLSGFNDAVSTVPEVALAPALAAIGGGAAGAATGGPGAGWAAGVGALAGGAAGTLSIALTTTDGGSVPERNQRFTVLVLVPAMLAALVGGGGAALFAEGRAVDEQNEQNEQSSVIEGAAR